MGRNNLKKNIIVAVVVGLLIFFHWINVLRPLENLAVAWINPILNSLSSAGSDIKNYYRDQTDRQDLSASINNLEERVRELTAEASRLKYLEEENNLLRGYLNFSKTNKTPSVIGNIIFHSDLSDSQEASRFFVIDRGSQDGLRVGLPAVDNHGLLVGKVIAIKEKTAEICLVTSKDCRIAVAAQSDAGTLGVSEGEFGLTIKINFVSQDKELKNGEIIITSGLEKEISRGLPVGKIIKIEKESNQLWQTVSLEPLAELDNLHMVAVLLPPSK